MVGLKEMADWNLLKMMRTTSYSVFINSSAMADTCTMAARYLQSMCIIIIARLTTRMAYGPRAYTWESGSLNHRGQDSHHATGLQPNCNVLG